MNTVRGFVQAQSLSLIALIVTFATLFAFAYFCQPSEIVTKCIGTVETLGVGYIIYKQGRELRQSDQNKTSNTGGTKTKTSIDS